MRSLVLPRCLPMADCSLRTARSRVAMAIRSTRRIEATQTTKRATSSSTTTRATTTHHRHQRTVRRRDTFLRPKPDRGRCRRPTRAGRLRTNRRREGTTGTVEGRGRIESRGRSKRRKGGNPSRRRRAFFFSVASLGPRARWQRGTPFCAHSPVPSPDVRACIVFIAHSSILLVIKTRSLGKSA